MSDASEFTGEGRPSSNNELGRFPERLKETIGEDSLRKFAGKCGLSEGVLRSYLRGNTYPTLDRLDAIAAAGGIRAAWLALGEGGKTQDEDHPWTGAPLDKQILFEIIVKLEGIFRHISKPWSPEDKAKLIILLHDEMMEGEMKADEIEKNVLRLIKLLS